MISRRMAALIGIVVCALVVAAGGLAIGGQDKPADPKALERVAGKYTGTANTPQGDMAIVAELKVAAGAITGTIGAGDFVLPVTAGALEGSTLTLTLDMNGTLMTLSGPFKDGRFEAAGSMGGSVVLTREGSAAASAAAPAGDPISGDWDGVADVPGEQSAFTLRLKLDGENVTGEAASAMGSVPLQTGRFTGGTLNLSLPFPSGDLLTMTATVKEGKLVGQLDLGGQFTAPWTATRRQQ